MTNNDELALKPGTYAILFRDNWDGEGDVYKTLATLGDDLVWYHHESGTSLIEYEGDEVLKVWPLDDGSNALSLLAERDADKKRIAEQLEQISSLEEGVNMLLAQYDQLASAIGWTTEKALAGEGNQEQYAEAMVNRIAELEARTVSVKLPEPPGPMSVGAKTVYCGIVADVVGAFQAGLDAAGIKLEVGE